MNNQTDNWLPTARKQCDNVAIVFDRIYGDLGFLHYVAKIQ